ncbi:hypothetical protein OGAPHI_003332 [Ogataea philodendri]|uniref:Uncharacterized protein n=1 Tax=Ogataea philodendri TaxID=1378263 RepID=A0A9P8P7A9_9ASCO|nr:uncharacterized protein OGAPHI_003332 [Ogataea philodendri]KAH3666883.1 hypothetical protein OGAPHI_003332 [Ogataea philodendri]
MSLNRKPFTSISVSESLSADLMNSNSRSSVVSLSLLATKIRPLERTDLIRSGQIESIPFGMIRPSRLLVVAKLIASLIERVN